MEPPTPGSLDHPDIGASLNEVFTPEMREKMVRLEKENEILRRRLTETDTLTGGGGGREGTAKNPSLEQGPVARGTGGGRKEGGGEDKTVATLQKHLQEKQQRISQLEAVAQESSQSNSPGMRTLKALLSEGLGYILISLLSPGSQASSLEEVRKVKDAEIEKYKKYLNKAKKIIEGFGEGKSRAAEDSLEVTTGASQM